MNNTPARPRKIGTFTLVLSLMAVGITFMFINFDSREQIRILFSLWPVILIFLGCEILISARLHPEYTLSVVSVIILIILLAFAFFMAFMEFAYSYYITHGYFF